MSNSVYGKSMESVRNQINFGLISCEEKALTIKTLDLIGVYLCKHKVKLNKVIFIG